MKARQSLDPMMKNKWCWPIDLGSYDRRFELDPDEREELSDWMHHQGRGYGKVRPQTARVLHRLMRPIQDFSEITDFPHKQYDHNRTAELLLLEVQQRQITFWAWSANDWIEIIGRNHKDFKQRFQKEQGRQHLLAFAYILFNFMDFWTLKFEKSGLAKKVFGQAIVNSAVQRILETLDQLRYVTTGNEMYNYRGLICELLLANRSPYLEDLSEKILVATREQLPSRKHQNSYIALSSALEQLGILSRPLERLTTAGRTFGSNSSKDEFSEEWFGWVQRWYDTSVLKLETRRRYSYALLATGRWLAQSHPEVTSPEQWTRQLAADFVAAVNRMRVGQFTRPHKSFAKMDEPFAARTKIQYFAALRTFFQDCQEWEWIPQNFNPAKAFVAPRAIAAGVKREPRQIDDNIWAKLLTAGLNLTVEDLEAVNAPNRDHWYPIEMVRALATVWLFCGLRHDDIRRLRLGCSRWQRMREQTSNADGSKADAEVPVCLIEIHQSKNEKTFTKAVDEAVGRAIVAWEKVRPEQPTIEDWKTGEQAHLLFAFRGKALGTPYLNTTLIPMLCQKAGVPESDVRGRITSHRARHTIFTQLSESMTLPELKSWSGHKRIESLHPYLELSAEKQSAAYQKTDYFKRNLRTFEILIDQDTIKSGAAAQGEAWKYHDLGHGYCTYDFFEKCPHRMACPKCDFYVAKQSVQAKLLESKESLQRLLQEIPLTQDERAAVEEGVEAFEQLCQKLMDVPTPTGFTPRQLGNLQA